MPASQKELISVVMPVYGEASHIGSVLADDWKMPASNSKWS
jgi:hypothetical protein